MAVDTNDAKWNDANGWNNGLVIVDSKENEFVWVPVDGTNVKYEKWCTSGTSYTSTEDDKSALPIVNGSTINQNDQITKYHGFYVGRYEASVSEKAGSGIPTVKSNTNIWVNLTYTNAIDYSMSFSNTDYVKSGLITGTQWDVICAWIDSEKDANGNPVHSVTDSRSWGWYSDSVSPANIIGNGKTGYSEYWKAKNIYDFAGNKWEYTAEKLSSNILLRSGQSGGSGQTFPASYRNVNTTLVRDYLGFRIVLYVI